MYSRRCNAWAWHMGLRDGGQAWVGGFMVIGGKGRATATIPTITPLEEWIRVTQPKSGHRTSPSQSSALSHSGQSQ